MHIDSYHPPVARLLTLGREPARRRVWPNYLHLGLQPRHAPELVRMATDRALLEAGERSPAVWAPVHAWRALGQLEAQTAASPLFALLESRADDADAFEEIPIVLGMIGRAALPEATLWLFDEARDERLRLAAIRILAEVGLEYPDRRDEAAAVLLQQLNDWPHQGPELNAWLISALVDLGESAAAPVMEAAFAAGKVALWVNGDWEDVQVDLGLLEERLTAPAAEYGDPYAPGLARAPRVDADASAKARRKAAKRARKRNRKRK